MTYNLIFPSLYKDNRDFETRYTEMDNQFRDTVKTDYAIAVYGYGNRSGYRIDLVCCDDLSDVFDAIGNADGIDLVRFENGYTGFVSPSNGMPTDTVYFIPVDDIKLSIIASAIDHDGIDLDIGTDFIADADTSDLQTYADCNVDYIGIDDGILTAILAI